MRKLRHTDQWRLVQSPIAGEPSSQPADSQLKVPGGLGPDGVWSTEWGGALPRKPAGHTGLATEGGTF